MMKGRWSQNLQFCLRIGLKLPRQKKLIFKSSLTILLCIVCEI